MNRLADASSKDFLFAGFSAAIGAGIGYSTYKFLKKVYDDIPPKKWRKVGSISEVWCFPIKSCGPVKMVGIECGLLGPGIGELRDRVFAISRPNGECVTARTFPKMIRIMPKIEGEILTVSAEGMSDIRIDISKLYSSNTIIKVKVWKDHADCIDCGDEAASWFSKCILGESEGVRLAFYPSNQPKPVIQPRGYLFKQADDLDTGSLQDETSFMLMNQGSFDDLNTKLEKKVVPLQYRPNFVVKGAAAWEEDSWKWIKIGRQTIFKTVQPCIRCILTNIDPATGERTPEMQPLKALNTFRSFEKIAKNGPYFGLHLGIRAEGLVMVGDEVFVEA